MLKTKRMKYILALFLFNLLACQKDLCIMEYEKFTAEEESWLAYNIGDTLIYQNDSLHRDTFVVYERKTSNYEPIDPGYSPGRECYHPIGGQYKMFNSNSTIDAELSITKDKTLQPDFHKHPYIKDFSTNLNVTTPIDKLLINGTEHKDVYVIKRDQFYGKEIIKSIKFNKDFGFIQYEMMNGIHWTLIEIKRK